MTIMDRYVGGVEVGGWPVPAVYWYRVLEDGTEEEVSTRTLYCTILCCTVLYCTDLAALSSHAGGWGARRRGAAVAAAAASRRTDTTAHLASI